MTRFGIVTPTIGRKTLKRCIESLDEQIFRSFFHIVVGDGPQPEWVSRFCAEKGVQYIETEKKEGTGTYGANPRNVVLKKLPSCDYVIFLDDDNVLMEPSLYQIDFAAVVAGNPPLLYQEILFTNKYKEEYYVLPKDKLVVEGEWDLLNGIYRRDMIEGVEFKPSYKNDFLFAQEVCALHPDAKWVKVKGIGGIHHLSWDTYHG
jgi:glycosyltransferase involved in cell wall biosynthesis